MSFVKNSLRYLLAQMTLTLGLSESVRRLYLRRAKTYVSALDQNAVKEVWVRRSVTNQDFKAFLSDIDLTVVVDENLLSQLHFPHDLLVKDIQIVPQKFLSTWLSAGGFRNYLQEDWIPLKSNSTLQPRKKIEDKSILAFELGHEIYLLYHQLEKKFHEGSDPLIHISREKLVAELNRVQQFWIKNDQSLLKEPRKNFVVQESFQNFIKKQDFFWQELTFHLEPPLNDYPIEDLIEAEFPDYYEMNLEMRGKQVLIVKKTDSLERFFTSHPHHFVVTENFFKLVKSVGVQEQDELNKLAHKKKGYYFDYNLQRLATDLVGAVVQYKEDHRLLYFCLKNIQEFTFAVTGQTVSDWESLEENWQKHDLIYRNNGELMELCRGYLEVLEGMR
jgi:predicted nucleotidyltransferase